MRSSAVILFFRGGDGLGRSFAAASLVSFSCESAVCSRVESWGRNWNRSRSPWLAEASSVEDLKHATKSARNETILRTSSTAKAYDVLRPKLGRVLFPIRRGGRLSSGLARIAASSSSQEEKLPSATSSESSTMSAPVACFFFAGPHGGEGATEADSSGALMNSRPGYSPSSGWGG
jgi:hypothetical protein